MKKLPLVLYVLFIAANVLATMKGTVGFQYDGNVNGSSNRDRLTQETSTRFGGYTENNTYDSAGNPTTFRPRR